MQLSNLLGCPPPIPTIDFSFAKTIALDLTNLQILKANFRLVICFGVGFFLVTIFNFLLKSNLFVSCKRKELSKNK